MSSVCILTDSTAQFPTPVFPGRTLVNFIALDVRVNDERYAKGEGLRAADLPPSARNGLDTQVMAPSVKAFEDNFMHLGGQYSQVIAILHSGYLTDTVANANKAAKALQGQVKVQIIDSQTTAIGLGLLVQAASASAEQGLDALEIERQVRHLIRKVYTLFCIEGLTYLELSGYLNPAQSLLGEYLKVLPLYVLNNGELVATQKARNHRHLVDLLHEFLWEFTELEHIGILQGAPPFEAETRALRERIAEDFPDTLVSEHTINGTLASMLGPRSLGLFVMQPEGNEF